MGHIYLGSARMESLLKILAWREKSLSPTNASDRLPFVSMVSNSNRYIMAQKSPLSKIFMSDVNFSGI